MFVVLGMFVMVQGCANPASTPSPRPTTPPADVPSATTNTRQDTPSPPVAAPNPTPASAPEPPPPARLTLEQRLDKRAVTDERYARRELYSWTTPDQLTLLRQTNTLLVATAKTHGAPSPYSRLLTRLSQTPGQTGELAKLFAEHPGLSKRRYAWPSPFATAIPLGERSYGHALLRIVLKDESYVAKLDPLEKDAFSFVDLRGSAVSLGDALQHPERIAAVFHIRRKPDGGPRFREYIVCNESMIARWSVGTPQERAVVTAEAALIADLLPSPLVSALGKTQPLDANIAWSHAADNPTLLDAWRATLAFDSPKYKPSPKTLKAIADSLAAYDPAGEPLEHAPTTSFPEKP